MGARAQVSIKDRIQDIPVYLYTHWGAGSLKEDIRIALERGKGRWDDYEYLSRILFDGMKGDDVTSETGFGIGISEHGDIELLIEILPDQKVRIGIDEWTFAEYIQEKFTIN